MDLRARSRCQFTSLWTKVLLLALREAAAVNPTLATFPLDSEQILHHHRGVGGGGVRNQTSRDRTWLHPSAAVEVNRSGFWQPSQSAPIPSAEAWGGSRTEQQLIITRFHLKQSLSRTWVKPLAEQWTAGTCIIYKAESTHSCIIHWTLPESESALFS